MLLHVTDVEVTEGYRLWLCFTDGSEGVADLQDDLYGEVFKPLRDLRLFSQVCLTNRTIEWPNGADFAPEYLRSLVQREDRMLT